MGEHDIGITVGTEICDYCPSSSGLFVSIVKDRFVQKEKNNRDGSPKYESTDRLIFLP